MSLRISPLKSVFAQSRQSHWWRAFVAAGLLSLPSAVSWSALPPEEIPYKSLQAPNACLPDALGFRNAYEVYQKMRRTVAWSRVLMVQSRVRGVAQSHAFCVFALEGKLWAYDQAAGCRRVWVAAEEKADATKVGRGLLPEQFDRALWIDQSF